VAFQKEEPNLETGNL